MKLSFTTLGCPDWDLPTIANNAKALGYDGVELRTSPDGNHLSPDAPDAEVVKVGQLFRDAGAPIMSVMGYSRFAFLDQAEIAKNQALLRRLVKVASLLKAPFIRTFAGQVPQGTDPDAMAQTVAAAIKPVAKEASDAGVMIALETHDDWCAGRRVMHVAEAVGPGFGIVYDIFNAFHAGIEPWHVTYDLVKSRIAYCHLKDGKKDSAGQTPYTLLGEGDLPIADLLGRFKADGYHGYFSFEWEKKWHPSLADPGISFPHYVATVRRMWAER